MALLAALTPAEWDCSSAAPGWTVKALALHLLDDDLGWLSRHRDGDRTGLLDEGDHDSFVRALAAKNQRWIDGTQTLSPRVVTDLLRWSGHQVDAYYATESLTGDSHVSWASDEPVPMWFDMAREFTERWVHQMQIREAVGRVGDYRDTYLATVLRIFTWALPHQFRVAEAAGVEVQVDLASGGLWHLVCEGGSNWSLHQGTAESPSASAYCADDCGWRWLTGADFMGEGVVLEGQPSLYQPLLDIRAVIV